MNANGFVISIIIPVFNGEKYLARCIDSIVLSAMGYDIEIIVVDDGSTDSSLTIAQSYGHQLSNITIIRQENQGPSAARNTGLRVAKGRYIGFVDCDDCVTPDYFYTLLNTCKSDPDIIVFGCENILLSGKRFVSNPQPQRHDNAAETLLANVNQDRQLFWLPSTKLFKATIIRDIQFEETIRLGEDTIFNLYAVANAKSVVRIDNCLYVRHQVSGSLSSNQYKPNLLTNMEKHFSLRVAIHKQQNYGLDQKVWRDIYDYYVFHILPWLFSNSSYLNNEQQLDELVKIRNSNLVGQCYLQRFALGRRPKMILMQLLFRARRFQSLQNLLTLMATTTK